MKRIYNYIVKYLDDPVFMQKFHAWAAIVWFVAAFPIMFFLNQSIPFLVFISVYAIVSSHWAANQAAEGEQEILKELRRLRG